MEPNTVTTTEGRRPCQNADGSAKRTYDTRADARKIARLTERSYKTRLAAYLCPACDKFHVGHQHSERSGGR